MPSLSAAVIGSCPPADSVRSSRAAAGGASSRGWVARDLAVERGLAAARGVVALGLETARGPVARGLEADARGFEAARGFAPRAEVPARAPDAPARADFAPPSAPEAAAFFGFTSAARFSLRRPGRERGRFPITPGSSVTQKTISRTPAGRRFPHP